MNSKLREALNKYAQDYYQLLRTGAHHEIAESKLAKAEKAIRQAVGEEMLGIVGRGRHASKEWLSSDEWIKQEATNKLRAELRAKIKDKFEVKE
jgi:hypothetical protein